MVSAAFIIGLGMHIYYSFGHGLRSDYVHGHMVFYLPVDV